jgi:hypothetical protein
VLKRCHTGLLDSPSSRDGVTGEFRRNLAEPSEAMPLSGLVAVDSFTASSPYRD